MTGLNVRIYINIFSLLIVSVWLSACGKLASSPLPGQGGNTGGGTIPANPVLLDVQYVQGGASQTIFGPFLNTISISPDFGGNGCTSSTSLITLTGIIDAANTANLTVTGATSTQLLTGSNFQINLCLPNGTTAITVTAYNSNKTSCVTPLQVSIAATGASLAVETLGFGSTKYPSTGFLAISSAVDWTQNTNNGYTLENAYIGPFGATTISGGGAGSYILSTGFTNYIATQSP